MSRNALGIGFVVVALALPVLSFGAAPAAAPAAGGLTLPDYTVSPGDTLDISVWKEPDLTKTVPIRPDGKFSFPLAGELVAQGRTVGQIQSELISRMQKYIPEPVVTVALSGMDGSRIYVIGQVAKAGSFATLSWSFIRASNRASGLGGQPATYTSTGKIRSTPCKTA